MVQTNVFVAAFCLASPHDLNPTLVQLDACALNLGMSQAECRINQLMRSRSGATLQPIRASNAVLSVRSRPATSRFIRSTAPIDWCDATTILSTKGFDPPCFDLVKLFGQRAPSSKRDRGEAGDGLLRALRSSDLAPSTEGCHEDGDHRPSCDELLYADPKRTGSRSPPSAGRPPLSQ